MVPAPSITPVPEPGTLVLVAAGVVADWRPGDGDEVGATD